MSGKDFPDWPVKALEEVDRLRTALAEKDKALVEMRERHAQERAGWLEHLKALTDPLVRAKMLEPTPPFILDAGRGGLCAADVAKVKKALALLLRRRTSHCGLCCDNPVPAAYTDYLKNHEGCVCDPDVKDAREALALLEGAGK